jgi:hypothetical protein
MRRNNVAFARRLVQFNFLDSPEHSAKNLILARLTVEATLLIQKHSR